MVKALEDKSVLVFVGGPILPECRDLDKGPTDGEPLLTDEADRVADSVIAKVGEDNVKDLGQLHW